MFFTEAQHALLEHVRKRGIKTQDVIRNKDGHNMSLEKLHATDGNRPNWFSTCNHSIDSNYKKKMIIFTLLFDCWI